MPGWAIFILLGQSSALVSYPVRASMSKVLPVPYMHSLQVNLAGLAAKPYRLVAWVYRLRLRPYWITSSDDLTLRQQAGDYFLKQMPRLKRLVLPELPLFDDQPLLPVWVSPEQRELDTVVYSSRKSFLREHNEEMDIAYIDNIASSALL
ncbi:hypothetical protein ALON55S_05234 [Alishewanella longhuensis]